MRRRTFVLSLLAGLLTRPASGASASGAQKSQEPRYPSPGPGHFVKENREGGRYLLLEDKSLWEIEPRSRFRTSEWQELEGISIRFADGEPPYAYELSNVDRDEGVAARWVRPER